jgi:hypothetical protein
MSTPPSASGTVAAGSNLEKTIQRTRKSLRRTFSPEDDDKMIKKGLTIAWNFVHDALSEGENLSSYWEVWRNRRCPVPKYLKMAHCFRPFGNKHADHRIPSLEAFLKPEPDNKTSQARAIGAQ